MHVRLQLPVVLLLLVGCGSAGEVRELNGFDVSDSLIPTSDIHRGGPPRDGIPALTDPAFENAGAATWLAGEDRVLGVARNGVAKAYPLGIMNWHEVVNDRFGDEHIVVTYCPLCYSGMAFEAGIDGERHLFGVSGLLFNSDVLLYDRSSESLWSQIMGSAVSGPMRGRDLAAVPLANTTWDSWQASHPDSLVLSPRTGYRRDYGRDPYADYAQSRELMFPVAFRARGHHPKERIIGIGIGGEYKAYPFVELRRTGGWFTDEVGGYSLTIMFDADSDTGRIEDADGEEVVSLTAYWFAWYAFHPETHVFRAPR